MLALDKSTVLPFIDSIVTKLASVTAPVTVTPLIKLELLMVPTTPAACNAAAVSLMVRTAPEAKVACKVLFKTL